MVYYYCSYTDSGTETGHMQWIGTEMGRPASTVTEKEAIILSSRILAGKLLLRQDNHFSGGNKL